MTVDDDQQRHANEDIVRTVMATITAGEFERLTDFVAEDLVFELPYGPSFIPDPVLGRQAWNDMQLMTFQLFSSFALELVELHPCVDPNLVIAEYRSTAVVARNGNDYRNRYIGVFRFRDGQISHWREFHNPEATQVL
jgi:ketosteroid isomerase-like protein